jgi:hypothetical protein
VDEGLAGIYERIEDRRRGRAVVGTRRVDDGVGRLGLGLQDRGIIERAENGCDPELADLLRTLCLSDEPSGLVAGLDERGGQRAADVAGCSGAEDLHGWAFHVSSQAARVITFDLKMPNRNHRLRARIIASSRHRRRSSVL